MFLVGSYRLQVPRSQSKQRHNFESEIIFPYGSVATIRVKPNKVGTVAYRLPTKPMVSRPVSGKLQTFAFASNFTVGFFQPPCSWISF